jgi:hypothetical protein
MVAAKVEAVSERVRDDIGLQEASKVVQKEA